MRNDGRQNPDATGAATANLAKDVHWITHATFWSQIGLGIIGIVALVIYGGQLSTMKSQLQQMQSDAKASSQQFQVQLGHYDAGLGVNQVQISKLDASITQARRLATATEKANANVVEADRPWIGAEARVPRLTAGTINTVSETFLNSGRRPAVADEADAAFYITGDKVIYPDRLLDATRAKYVDPPSTAFIVPGARLTVPVPPLFLRACSRSSE